MSIERTARFSAALLLAIGAACSRQRTGGDTSSAAGALGTPDTNAPAIAPMPTPPAAGAGIVLVVVHRPDVGMFLADANGHAVYMLDGTPSDTNTWKPVSGQSAPTSTDTSIKSSMLGTTSAAGGAMQATYNGKPLYYYSGDAGPNDTKGNNKHEAGATGHLIGPAGGMVNAGSGMKKNRMK